jgi:hypothetical protein
MAYVIELNNEVVNFAENETQKNDLIHFFPPAVSHEISDENFTKIKKNLAVVSVSGGVISITENAQYATDEFAPDETSLKQYHNVLKGLLKVYLNAHNTSHSIYSDAQSYYNTLNTLDYSTLTFPFIGTWEKYCEDNSITYIHTLQIP